MNFVIIFFGWIFSLCLHEFAHAYVAYRGGDYTVKEKGYLSFNPLRYMDPFTSIILPLIFLFIGGIGLPGGAVYIETWRLRSRYWISAMALAGPAANAIFAIFLAILLRFLPPSLSILPGLNFLLVLQIWAILFNLIPLPPLDGWRIIEPYLSEAIIIQVRSFGMFSILILFLVFRYTFIGSMFSFVVTLISLVLGTDLFLASQGQNYLFEYFRYLLG